MGERPWLLDLFSGAGGAGEGYRRAGFHVVAVDIAKQPHNPHEFYQDDALSVLDTLLAPGGTWRGYRLHDFQAIHTSPPCQGYSVSKGLAAGTAPLLIGTMLTRLYATGVTFIVENVAGAFRELPSSIVLCGTQFGLRVYRHRLFQSNVLLMAPGAACSHPHYLADGYVCVYGNGARRRQVGNRGNRYQRVHVAEARAAMGIDWMTQAELSQAIPPAYTEWLGRQLYRIIQVTAA